MDYRRLALSMDDMRLSVNSEGPKYASGLGFTHTGGLTVVVCLGIVKDSGQG